MALLPEDIIQINQLIEQYFSANMTGMKLTTMPLASTLEGLYTMGVDAANNSVRVALQFIKDSTKLADNAALNADKEAAKAKQQALLAFEATEAANNAAAITKPLRFIWDGTSLGLKFEGDPDYVYTDLKGATGNSLEFKWTGTILGIRVEGQTLFTEMELGGKDAYQLALSLDPTIGTMAEWIQSIKQPALDAAAAADTAREAIQSDLAAKAAHGYGTEPQKTLKQVDDDIVQIAADLSVSQAEQDSSIKTIEQLLSQSNLNQTAQVSSTGREVVSLPKTASHGGMDVKLEGLTAENKVVNGDFRNGTAGWNTYSPGVVLSIEGDYMTYISNSPSQAIAQTGKSYATGDKLYIYAIMKVDDAPDLLTAGVALSSVGASLLPNVTVGVTDTVVKGIVQAVSNLTSIVFGRSAVANKKVYLKKGARVINLTQIFGPGNEITDLPTLDKIFSSYFEGTKSMVSTGRVRSVGKNLINSAKFTDNYIGITSKPISWSVGSNYIEMSTLNGADSTGLGQKYKIYPGTYRASASGIIYDGTGSVSIYFRDKNNTNILIAGLTNPQTFTVTPEQAAVIDRVMIYKGGGYTSKSVRINNLQLERNSVATAYEIYKETKANLAAPDLKSNGLVKDEVRKGINGYEHVKRVGVGTLGAELITNGAFNDATGWTLNTDPTSGNNWTISGGTLNHNAIASTGTILQSIISANLLANKVYLVKFTVSGGGSQARFSVRGAVIVYKDYATYIDGAYSILVSSPSTGSGIGFYASQVSSSFSIDNFSVKEVTSSDLINVASSVTEYGANIHFSLATPVVTPIDHAGILNSAESGTVYHEPVVADAGIYGAKMDILNTAYPIASLEEIIVHTDVDTYLDVSAAVIAADGLSFTHPSLVSGDLVLFTYAFAKEKVNGMLTATFYDGRYVIADSTNGKFYKWGVKSTNGVPAINLTEV